MTLFESERIDTIVQCFNRSLPSDGNLERALELHMERCRLFQLRITLSNKQFSGCIFHTKVFVLGAGILGIFFAIKLYESSFALAASSAYVAMVDCVMFVVIFGRACDVPENMENYKREIRRLGRRNVAAARSSDDFCKLLERFLKSIRKTGVSLGGFYCFESISTLVFWDFIFNQAIGLLLTYRDPIVV